MNSVRFRVTRFLSRHPAMLSVLGWLNRNNPGGGMSP
jgi:hypothetical protein